MVRENKEPLPAKRVDFIRQYYPKRKARYICDTLTEGELVAIDGTEGLDPSRDYLILAKVKIIMRDPELVKRFDSCMPIDTHHYHELERHWLEHERELLAWELHRKPTEHELFQDFMENQNGLRFKIFYCLKFPDKVERE